MTNTRASNPTVHRISGFIIFLLLAMLAIFSLVAVMLGIQVYNTVVDTADNNSAVRVSLSYLTMKIRTSDADGSVRLISDEGIDVLVIGDENSAGERVNTYIFFSNGRLKEYTAGAEMAFSPVGGTTIVSLSSFEMTRAGNLLYVRLEDEAGNAYEMHLYVNTGISDARVDTPQAEVQDE